MKNFYEWLHKQENFKVWLKTDKFCLDKDILIKGNKVYGPDTCCLVPDYVNTLFTTSGGKRGQLPIGVAYRKDCVDNPYRPQKSLGMQKNYATPEEAFLAYKEWKEAYIKQVAQEEYDKGTISKKCYEAMMRWEVEIGD